MDADALAETPRRVPDAYEGAPLAAEPELLCDECFEKLDEYIE